jgi:MFS transporter, SP family, arabinose:H+ symporter
LFQINVVVGILLAYLSNLLIGTFSIGDFEWRWKLGISALPALLFFVMLFTIPRSPRWLVSKGLNQDARKVLEAIGSDDPEGELKSIVENLTSEHCQPKERLFCAKYRYPIFLAVTIGMFNQLSGINAILYYLNDIFALAGFNKVSSDMQAVIIGCTNLTFCLAAMSVIDRLGRKTLLLIGSIGTALCLGGVATIFFLQREMQSLLWLLIFYIGFFSFSQGAVIWVYISEIFPTPVRSKGQSLGSSAHWVMNAIISGLYPVIAKSSGAFPFAFFCLMMLVQFVIVWRFFPETKGVTLEDMEHRVGIS